MRRAIYLLSILVIVAIAVNVAYFTNMSDVGLKIVAGLGGLLFFIFGFMFGFRNAPENISRRR